MSEQQPVQADEIADSRRGCGDRGDTMLMTTVFITFLVISAWALISGSQQWGARRDVQAAASAAARAGAQLSPEEVRGPGGTAIDPALAAQRANLVLAASGYSGSVTVSGFDVIVVATGGVSYAFPAPGFPTSLTATATSNAQQGVEEGQ